jgi:hypothetical protein
LDALLRVPPYAFRMGPPIKGQGSWTRCCASARAWPHDAEKQMVNPFPSFALWKIFTSLLKSACRFKKERYFRTPFFRKEKR